MPMQQSFDIDLDDAHTLKVVNKYFQFRLKDYRHELHKHFKKGSDPHHNLPSGILQKDWYVYCTQYSSEEFQVIQYNLNSLFTNCTTKVM